ncbi:hypothetical protein Egran_07091 [Elaphomyces granulatus]|uniref:Uncharacterized protein n=1 Tax=Elaphomyces granulatus TaxID=519963 RepID=A0A232LLW0_9EURO|nr:hypothetical protein Egran_07091 [Elaphomyces granulatus]
MARAFSECGIKTSAVTHTGRKAGALHMEMMGLGIESIRRHGYPRRMSFCHWYGPSLINGHAKPLPMDVLRTWLLAPSPTYFSTCAKSSSKTLSS